MSRTAYFGWMGFYVLLLIYLAAHFSELTWLDNLHLPIHEGGHLLFGWFGETLGVWGGTILQLMVPALLAAAFVARADLLGTTFCVFAFFHSLTGVATYMIDALRRELPLVTVGAPADEAEHDWVHIFGDLGVLRHAIQIGTAVRLMAWIGFVATLVWFSWETKKSNTTKNSSRAVKTDNNEKLRGIAREITIRTPGLYGSSIIHLPFERLHRQHCSWPTCENNLPFPLRQD